jgi:hypothetical protein
MRRWEKGASMINRRTVLAATASLALAPRAFAGGPLPGAEEYRLLAEEGRYLPLLREIERQSATTASVKGYLAQLRALVGDEDGAFADAPTKRLAVPDLAGAKVEDAMEAIVGAARSRQIVILNEAHHASRCRAFAEVLALRLRREGFAVFAAETFANTPAPSGADRLNAGAPLTSALGWYLADPVYAEAVRAARRRGYRFASYEARAQQMMSAGPTAAQRIETREDAEANNFIADILAKNAKARVFVYCGYSHLLKAAEDNGQLWFAARLRAKTGIDPLCISQCWTVPPPDPSREAPAITAILDAFKPVAPVVVRDRSGEALRLSAAKAAIDIEVVHPRVAKVEGRPGWLAAMPGRNKVRFALPAKTAANSLVQAVLSSDSATPNAVPSDQYPVPADAREAVFFLTTGVYDIRLETDAGRSVLGQIKV